MTTEVMIIAGEASGDLHGANLIRAMKQYRPHLTFCGMGGGCNGLGWCRNSL